MGLDFIGAAPDAKQPHPLSLVDVGIALAAGAAGAALWRGHRVLGFLGASALGSNAHAVATGRRGWKDAARRLGKHVVATGGALALTSHPAIGYVGGAVAADLLLDGNGGGLLEEFAHYTGIQETETVKLVPETAGGERALVATKKAR